MSYSEAILTSLGIPIDIPVVREVLVKEIYCEGKWSA